ncbi:HEPN domain-containing protein [Desulfoluna spongiiphila]|uniref:HEPN domain-containing protein n=1 Tax=Desulfoluna spongiiphila TaxID=419481 RepID=UPI0012550787|nr:HEPN domain-containing protein [Desulfoluna spongiiphila]VVS90766.1 hypothetical protein DBB_3340 [Desulfoluna spongiiphila]
MNQKLLSLIRIFNHSFMSYILNFKMDESIRKAQLNERQVYVLDELFNVAKQERISEISEHGNLIGESSYDTLRTYLFAGGGRNFNKLKKYTGDGDKISGAFSIDTDGYWGEMFALVVEVYPLFLSSFENGFMNRMKFPHYEGFIKPGVIDKYVVKRGTKTYFSVRAEVHGFTESLFCSIPIDRFLHCFLATSFENCCYRMTVSRDDFVNEVKKNYDSMAIPSKDLSVFVGIYGFVFRGFEAIEVDDLTVRGIDIYKDPMSSTIKYVADIDGINFNVMGVVAESKYKIEIVKNKKINTTVSLEKELSSELKNHTKNRIDNFGFSVLLAKGILKNIELYFINSGFIFKERMCFEPSINVRNGKKIVIESSDIESIKHWYGLLKQCKSKHIIKPLKDIQSAVLRDRDDKYAIIDALISWEAMFTTRTPGEVSSSVINSISTYLKKGDLEFKDRVKKLYDLRSDIVHGREPKLFKKESIYELKVEVVNIALGCIKKLLSDNDLRDMKPSRRVNYIEKQFDGTNETT